MEEWKSAFESYEVSNYGNIRKKLYNGLYRILGCSLLKRGTGYKYFQTNRGGKRTNYLVHHLVALAFIGERPSDYVIDHIDRNSLNNNASNLQYVTFQENMRNTDRFRTDVSPELSKIERQRLVQKKNREENDYNARKRERVVCNKCSKELCRAYLTAHIALRCGMNRKVGRKPKNIIKSSDL